MDNNNPMGTSILTTYEFNLETKSTKFMIGLNVGKKAKETKMLSRNLCVPSRYRQGFYPLWSWWKYQKRKKFKGGWQTHYWTF